MLPRRVEKERCRDDCSAYQQIAPTDFSLVHAPSVVFVFE
jgi:hypothetical protein